MTKKKDKSIRLRITDTLGNVSYLQRRGDECFSLVSSGGTPLALWNIAAHNAAGLQWELDCLREGDAIEAARLVRKVAYKHLKVEVAS